MISKTCKKCFLTLSLNNFYRHSKMADGHLNICKKCKNNYANEWNKNNLDVRHTIANKSRKKNYNSKRVAEAFSKWYYTTSKASGGYSRMIERNSIRGRIEKQASPSWSNKFFIYEIYALAKMRTEFTGISFEVDHIIPLKHPLVCGLHCESNMQIISSFDNKSKKNYWWPDMPNKRIDN